MRKSITISFAAFFIPFYVFFALMNSSLTHVYITSILAHSVLMIIICSTAFSICYFYYMNYVRNSDLQFFAISLFFGIAGSTFFFHVISIPSFYFLSEYIFDITEHYGLFFAGLALTLMFLPDGLAKNLFYDHRKSIMYCCVFGILAWFVLLLASPGLSLLLFEQVNVVVFLSGILLVSGIVALLIKRTEICHHTSSAYLVAGLSVLANAMIIPFFYKEWNIVWWYFHLVILCGEIIVFIGILKKSDKKNEHLA